MKTNTPYFLSRAILLVGLIVAGSYLDTSFTYAQPLHEATTDTNSSLKRNLIDDNNTPCEYGVEASTSATNQGRATATIQQDGSILLTGSVLAGGSPHRSITLEELGAPAIEVVPFSNNGFAAQLSNGKVCCWGDENHSRTPKNHPYLHFLEIPAQKIASLNLYHNVVYHLYDCDESFFGSYAKGNISTALNNYGLLLLGKEDQHLHLFAHTYSCTQEKISPDPPIIEQSDLPYQMSNPTYDDFYINDAGVFMVKDDQSIMMPIYTNQPIFPYFSHVWKPKTTHFYLERISPNLNPDPLKITVYAKGGNIISEEKESINFISEENLEENIKNQLPIENKEYWYWRYQLREPNS